MVQELLENFLQYKSPPRSFTQGFVFVIIFFFGLPTSLLLSFRTHSLFFFLLHHSSFLSSIRVLKRLKPLKIQMYGSDRIRNSAESTILWVHHGSRSDTINFLFFSVGNNTFPSVAKKKRFMNFAKLKFEGELLIGAGSGLSVLWLFSPFFLFKFLD